MADSEPTELLRSVEANGLGLVIIWALLAVLKMACKFGMAGCFATSIMIMPNGFAMVVPNISEMVTSAGVAGLVMEIMVL